MKNILTILCLVFALSSCNDDSYIVGGDLAQPEVHKTTYDYLKSNPIFDTLVMAIDKCGLKEEVNKCKTFYAPTNFSFNQYVVTELSALRQIDPTAEYTFDSIPTYSLDSLKMYMFKETYDRSNLTEEGVIVKSVLGHELKLTMEPQNLNGLVNPVQVLHIIQKAGAVWGDTQIINGEEVKDESDNKSRIESSGIITTTGTVHVIERKHVLFYHRQKK